MSAQLWPAQSAKWLRNSSEPTLLTKYSCNKARFIVISQKKTSANYSLIDLWAEISIGIEPRCNNVPVDSGHLKSIILCKIASNTLNLSKEGQQGVHPILTHSVHPPRPPISALRFCLSITTSSQLGLIQNRIPNYKYLHLLQSPQVPRC